MHLFLKTNNITAALMILTILAIYYGSDIVVNGHRLGNQWHLLTIFSFLFLAGCCRPRFVLEEKLRGVRLVAFQPPQGRTKQAVLDGLPLWVDGEIKKIRG